MTGKSKFTLWYQNKACTMNKNISFGRITCCCCCWLLPVMITKKKKKDCGPTFSHIKPFLSHSLLNKWHWSFIAQALFLSQKLKLHFQNINLHFESLLLLISFSVGGSLKFFFYYHCSSLEIIATGAIIWFQFSFFFMLRFTAEGVLCTWKWMTQWKQNVPLKDVETVGFLLYNRVSEALNSRVKEQMLSSCLPLRKLGPTVKSDIPWLFCVVYFPWEVKHDLYMRRCVTHIILQLPQLESHSQDSSPPTRMPYISFRAFLEIVFAFMATCLSLWLWENGQGLWVHVSSVTTSTS